MTKEHENWWRNPKDHIFWLVYIPIAFLLISVVFNILFLMRQTPVPTSLKGQPLAEQVKDTMSVLGLEGPRQLQEILDKYPLIQAQETFNTFYRGKTVKWKGIVIYVFKSLDSYYVKREDSLTSSGNVTLLDSYELITENAYHLTLQHRDGYWFEAIVGEQWHEVIDFLHKGDTICVEGRIADLREIVGHIVIEK